MTKRSVTILAALCAVLFLLSAAGANAMRDDTVMTVAVGTGEPQEYASHQVGWKAAVSGSSEDPITVRLYKNWIAASGSFGAGDGFYRGAVRVPANTAVTVDLNGFDIDRGLTAPVQNGCVLYSEGNLTLENGKKSAVGSVKGGNSVANGGGLILDGVKATGGGLLEITETGEVTLSGAAALGNVKLARGRTVMLSADFTANGPAGTILLGDDYTLGRQVLTLNGDTGKYAKYFKLGDAPDTSWYVGDDVCLACKSAAEALLLDALKLGKGAKVAAKNLLPLTFTGGVTWESDNPSVLKVLGVLTEAA